MGKTFTHPQPHWLPLHELPFLFPEPKTTKLLPVNEADIFEFVMEPHNGLLKNRCNGIAWKFRIHRGFEFTGIDVENKNFEFKVDERNYTKQWDDDIEIIKIDFDMITGKSQYLGCLSGLGADINAYLKSIWGTATDHFLEDIPAGLIIWARPDNPRSDFIRIENTSLKFYKTIDIIGGILACGDREMLFDARIEQEVVLETDLASENKEAKAIEFAAAQLRSNQNMTKEELKDTLGRRFLVISDRRMQRIWAKARVMAGLSEFAKAGRKPGKSNR